MQKKSLNDNLTDELKKRYSKKITITYGHPGYEWTKEFTLQEMLKDAKLITKGNKDV